MINGHTRRVRPSVIHMYSVIITACNNTLEVKAERQQQRWQAGASKNAYTMIEQNLFV